MNNIHPNSVVTINKTYVKEITFPVFNYIINNTRVFSILQLHKLNMYYNLFICKHNLNDLHVHSKIFLIIAPYILELKEDFHNTLY